MPLAPPLPDLTRLFDTIGRVAERLGSFDAYVEIVGMINSLVPSPRAQVMYYPRLSRPRYLYTIDTPDAEQQTYLECFQFDPFYKAMTNLSAPTVLQFSDLVDRSVATDAYLSIFYPQTGAIDELAILLPVFGGGVVGIFFQSKRQYTTDEVELVRDLLPMIAAFHGVQDRLTLLSAHSGQHQGGYDRYVILLDDAGRETFRSPEMARLEATNPGLRGAVEAIALRPSGSSLQIPEGTLRMDDLREGLAAVLGGRICFYHPGPPAAPPLEPALAIERFLDALDLSPRQNEVLALTLLGYPASKIAEKLGLSEGTVRNHRKQIYEKLDVTTEREIFGMLLSHTVSRGGSAQAQDRIR